MRWKQQEKWFEAEVSRIAGEIAVNSPEHDVAKAQAYFEQRAFDRACAAGKVLGTARGDIIAEKRMTEEPAHEFVQ